jgi:hypothetical protein
MIEVAVMLAVSAVALVSKIVLWTLAGLVLIRAWKK